MDSKQLSVQHHNGGGGVSKPPVHSSGRKGGRQSGGKGVKVVYISSPMMLTASAAEFRAVVQELTGRDSNVADHDLHNAAGAPSSSSNNSWSSSSSYSSFGGRASPTTMATGARAETMASTAIAASPGQPAEYAAGGLAAPPSFQGVYYDQTAGSLIYGQDYWQDHHRFPHLR